jgi:hypothetical protein
MRYFTALLFYRFRHFESAHLKGILEAVMPYRAGVVNVAGEMAFFKRLIQDLQADICKSHELVARLWLDTESGERWVQSLHHARASNKSLPPVERSKLAEDLELSIKDVGSLWASIHSAAHPKHWDMDAWNDDVGISDDYIFAFIEDASYTLIAKMISGLHVGVKAQRCTNVSARLKMLTSISNVDYPDSWPDLPEDGVALPDSPEGWKGYPDFYQSCTDTHDFAALFARFGDSGIGLFCKITNKPFPQLSEEQSEPNLPESLSTQGESKQGTDLEDSQNTQESTADNGPMSKQSTAEQDSSSNKEVTTDTSTSHPHGQTDLDSGETTPKATDQYYVHHGEYLVDKDGNPISVEGYDDDDEPAQSGWMHAGDEVDKHRSEAMLFIARCAGTNREEDYKAIQRWLDYNNPDMSFLTPRAFELARIGGLGLARYALDDLMSDAAMYEQMAVHFAEKRVERLAEAAQLAATLKDIEQKLTAAEAEAAGYRAASGVYSTTQQNLTNKRRILARVEMQLQGARARAPLGPSGRNHAAMGPPVVPGRQTPQLPPAPVTPVRQNPGGQSAPGTSESHGSGSEERQTPAPPAHPRRSREFQESQWGA